MTDESRRDPSADDDELDDEDGDLEVTDERLADKTRKRIRLPLADPERVPPKRERPPGYTRRQVLGTAAAAGAAIAGGLLLLDRNPGVAREHSERVRDHRVERPAGAVEMAIARGGDPAENARKAVEALGGMEGFVRKGERVVIKPNIGWNRKPEQASNTNPDVVAQVVRMVLAAGAAEVVVTDVPVNNAERCFSRSGIRAAAEGAGARVVLPESVGFRSVDVGGVVLRVARVLTPFLDADRIINIPVAKQHGLTRATLSMKNWYGLLGGHRVLLHQDIHRSIVDLATMIKPTLTIMDGTRILTANGPSGGSLDDVQRKDTVAASVDQVAIDAFGAGLLGLKPEDVEYIGRGEKAGLGRSDYKSLKLVEV